MRDQPTTLRAMLTSCKEATGLMVNLAYGAVFFGDPDMASEVAGLGADLTELAHEMRVVAILGARTRGDAEDMASVLQVIGAMEDLGRHAVDIAGIASRRVGIPAGLVTELSKGESVLIRIMIGSDSPLAGAPLSSFELPLAAGSWVIAVRRGGLWITHIEGSTVLQPDDVAVLVGPQLGLERVRALAGAPTSPIPSSADEKTGTGFDDAVDVLGQMKTLSEVAVGLAYAVLLTSDPALADEVSALAERLDHLKDDLHAWVLHAAHATGNASGLGSLLLLSQAANDLGDRAAEMVLHVMRKKRMHPVLALALGESDEVAKKVTIAQGSQADGAALRDVADGTGFDILALRRDGRYQHRPTHDITLGAGDELIATGPQQGRALLLARCETVR